MIKIEFAVCVVMRHTKLFAPFGRTLAAAAVPGIIKAHVEKSAFF